MRTTNTVVYKALGKISAHAYSRTRKKAHQPKWIQSLEHKHPTKQSTYNVLHLNHNPRSHYMRANNSLPNVRRMESRLTLGKSQSITHTDQVHELVSKLRCCRTKNPINENAT